jgi:hypothetical protein
MEPTNTTTANATAVADGVQSMTRLDYFHAYFYGQYVGEDDTYTMATHQFNEQEREHARLIAQAQRDLRELSERCFEYGNFDDE